MHMLFDGYWWFQGPPSGHRVLRETVAAWRRAFPDDRLTVAAPRGGSGPAVPGVELRRTLAANHLLINTVELPRLARRCGADAVLTQNFATRFPRSGVYLHDVIFQDSPQWFDRVERLYFAAMPLAARRAGVVLTSSRTEADRIRRHNPALAAVVPTGLGISTPLLRAEPQRPPQLDLVPGAFTLSVGRLNIRKNLATTIEAALASGLTSPATPLVVVGERSGRADALGPAAAAAVADGSVVLLGYAPDAQLRWLYEHCAVMVFLSLDEGFGLPVVEASWFGAPFVAGDIPVMREVLHGTDAVLVDPLSVTEVSAALQAVHRRPRRAASGARPVGSGVDPRWEQAVTVVREQLQGAPAVVGA